MEKYARFRYQPCLPLGEDGRRVTASKEHIALSRRAAAEGMVLLKNEKNALPLKRGEKVALFGKTSFEYIKGGGGSGDVHCPYIRSVYDGFLQKCEESKTEVYLPLLEYYKKYVEEAEKNVPTQEQINATWDIVNNMEFCQLRDDMTYDTFQSMFVKEADIPDELMQNAAAYAQTAIITIGRFSAEGTDRRVIGGDYVLSDTEKRLIDRVTEFFDKVIIVLNAGAVLDCEYFAENNKIQAVLMAWQAGMEGGGAIADILCGDINPSGKLPDTIVKDYTSYPSKADYEAGFDHVDYSEDIYVGYRYFNTIPDKAKCVRYPFGFGLSYTNFEISSHLCGESDGKIFAVCTVKNIGKVSGKEVVQLYYAAPSGKLGKPSKVLGAFGKTGELAPGASETVVLTMETADMASFDDLGKIRKSAYVLEKGNYFFYIGTSSANNQKTEFFYTVKEDTIIKECSSFCKPFKLEKRMLADGSYEALPMGEESYYYGKNKPSGAKAPEKCVMFDKAGEECTMDEFVAQFTMDELKDFVGGQPPTGVANTGCFGGLPRLGVPAVPTADGPAGLRLEPKTGIPTTSWPCATLLAATWNEKLVYEVGAAAASELRENNLGVWLAPALNIHRNPLCGRNFEYFSEDPYLAGKLAGAEIRGIQSQKVAVSMKHFACNNKEPNRFACDSRISERALREIYLRPFEICVKEADPWAVMSSYNLINGQHTSESYELLTGILRSEWDFQGMVVTDWGVKNDPVKEVKAGNDMKMHCGYPEDLQAGLDDGRITRADLELCVKRILKTFTKLA